jgi:hypothetical protein
MFAAAIARVVEQRGRRRRTGERPAIADVDPQSGRIGLALGNDRHRGVPRLREGRLAVQALGG